MNGPAKDLQIKITTSADVSGAEAAERAIERVAEKADEANRQQRDNAAASLHERARAALVGINKESGAEWIKKVLGDPAAAADAANKSFTALSQSGQNMGRVFRGLGESTAGGLRGLLGLTNAVRGLIGLFGRIGAVLMGPVGLALGAAAAGIAYLGKVARDNQRAIENIFREAAEGSARLKTRYEELDTAAEKSLESQIEDVRKLTQEYTALTGAMDDAGKRVNELNAAREAAMAARTDRDEQAALTRAKTPEEREKIAADFAARRETSKVQRQGDALFESELNAKNRIKEAEDAAARKRAEVGRAEAEVRTATQRKKDATALARQAMDEKREGSPAHKAALEEAWAADRAAKNADANLQKMRGEAEAVGAKSEAEIQQARHTLELVSIQREALKFQIEAVSLARANAAAPKIKELSGQAQAAMVKQDFTAQEKAVAELGTVRASLQRQGPTILEATQEVARVATENTALVITSINGQSTALKKQNRILLNQREQSQ